MGVALQIQRTKILERDHRVCRVETPVLICTVVDDMTK